MNAPWPLSISSADGSGQNVHPDVLRVEEGFAGFRYWMACTPYPFMVDRFENPAVRASHDGLKWELPAGAPDPVVPAPSSPEAHHADTDLSLVGGRLHLVYMTHDRRRLRTTFSLTTSLDGRSWSEPTVIYEGVWGVSPALVWSKEGWHLWFVILDVGRGFRASRLVVRKGPDLERLTDETECRIDIPGHVPWHIDVIAGPGGFEALVAAFPLGLDPSFCRLFHLLSVDGVRFSSTSDRPILKPSRASWDCRMIYRSTFLRDPDGRYRVWYTGGAWSRRVGIGYVEGPLDDLRPVGSSPVLISHRLSLLFGNAYGYARFLARRLARGIG